MDIAHVLNLKGNTLGMWEAERRCMLRSWMCLWHFTLGKVVCVSLPTFSNPFILRSLKPTSPSDHLVCLELSTSILLDLMSVYYTAKWEMVSHELGSEDLSLKWAICIYSTGSTRAEDWKDRHGMCPGDSEIKGSCRETMRGNDSDWCAELTWHLTRLSCWVCNCNKCRGLYTNSCAGSWWNWNSQGDS